MLLLMRRVHHAQRALKGECLLLLLLLLLRLLLLLLTGFKDITRGHCRHSPVQGSPPQTPPGQPG